MTDSAAQKSYIYAGDGAAEFNRLATQAKTMFHEEQVVLTQLGLKAGQTCVDAGCGPGFLTMQLSELIGHGKLYGYDFDPKLVELARTNCAHLSNVEIKKASVYDLPQESSSADFVYSRFVFSHLSEPVKALREYKRLLKPGGTAAILDVDDGLIVAHPEMPSFMSVIGQAMEKQHAAGGDRLIGRKLSQIFSEAGFTNPQVVCKMFVINNSSTAPLFDIFVDGRLDYVSDVTKSAFETQRSTWKKAIEAGEATVLMPVIYAFGRA